MRDCAIAPAHIAHGSKVTIKVHPSSRDFCNRVDAFLIATISACAVGSLFASRSLDPVPTTTPSALTIIAPTGTSPVASA